jgi:hypothetical protein
VTRLRRKEAKEANIEENIRGIAKEEGVTMSEIGSRCGKGLKGGKTGISGKTGR